MNKKFATKVKNILVTVCSMALVLSFSVAVPYASEIDIPSAYQFPGASITMYAMGNNSSKDCMISGYWMVY